MSEALGEADSVFVDTNVFIAVGRPDNEQFQAFRTVIRRHAVVLQVPQRVESELRTMQRTGSLDTALDEGWATVIDPPAPTDSDAVAAMDLARRMIASQTSKSEHEVEKADTVFAGLAVQHLRQHGAERVVVLTDDRVAASAIQRAIEQQEYGESITVLRRSDVIDTSGEF
jgi:predicted nucleic acid-binding protein